MSRKDRLDEDVNKDLNEAVNKDIEALTPAQRAVLERFRERRDRQQAVPRLVATSKPNQPIAIEHPEVTDALGMMLAFGTTEPEVASLFLDHLLNAACEGSSSRPPSEQDINRVLASIHGIGAADQLEGMLAVHMVATHIAAMRALRRLKGAETIQQQESNGNLAIKLLRTFTAQMETLQRHRGKGQQKMTVEHVHVHAGGRAIVGPVTAERSLPGGGSHEKGKGQPHAPDAGGTADECGSPMWSDDAAAKTLQISSGSRQGSLPDARRSKRQRRAAR